MNRIISKSEREIKIMRRAGAIVAETFQLLESNIKPGVTTAELDKIAEDYIRSQEATPAFKNYRGFPASICASVNEEIVHGLPNDRKLKEGDVISIDIGTRYKNYIGDSARTFPVGQISSEAQQLLKVCRECLEFAIEAAQPGNRVSDIGRAVQSHADKYGYGIVREYTGHGIGTGLHEEPQIPNYVEKKPKGPDPILKPGYCIAIEPMLNLGTHKTKPVRKKGWEVVITKDKKLSAHFEHSVAITKDGPIILTLPEEGQKNESP